MKQKLNVNTKKTREYSTLTANHLLTVSRPVSQLHVQIRRKTSSVAFINCLVSAIGHFKAASRVSDVSHGSKRNFRSLYTTRRLTHSSAHRSFFPSASLTRTHNGGARNTSQNKSLHIIEFVDPLHSPLLNPAIPLDFYSATQS